MIDPKLHLTAQVHTPGVVHIKFTLTGKDETTYGESTLTETKAQDIALGVFRAQGAAMERTRLVAALQAPEVSARIAAAIGEPARIDEVLARLAVELVAGRL